MSISLILDILDGKVARALGQTSLFGARFDLILDMISLVLLSFYAAATAQNGWIQFLFILCALNDLLGYAMQLHLFYGQGRLSSLNHKDLLRKMGFLLPIYYSAVGLGLSNHLHHAYLLTYVYLPSWVNSYLLLLFAVGFAFRQLAVAEQSIRILTLLRDRAARS
jgi:phosphatidylglycerophosphate synthase